tara:strand:- start:3050 stop:3658 length:609 start_codon:yes stop_codon:yes gene_type:complete
MSSIKLTADSGGGTFEIKAPSSGSNTRVLTVPDTGDATFLTSLSSVGKILQVKQAIKSDRQTIQSTTLVDITGMSVSITPSSTSSKILVDYSLVVFSNVQYYTMRLLRNNDSTIFIGDQNPNATSQSRGAFGTYQASYVNAMTVSQKFLDSPNTTSATTYKLQAHCPYSSSYIIGINSAVNQDNYTYMTNCVSSITVMEVAA